MYTHRVLLYFLYLSSFPLVLAFLSCFRPRPSTHPCHSFSALCSALLSPALNGPFGCTLLSLSPFSHPFLSFRSTQPLSYLCDSLYYTLSIHTVIDRYPAPAVSSDSSLLLSWDSIDRRDQSILLQSQIIVRHTSLALTQHYRSHSHPLALSPHTRVTPQLIRFLHFTHSLTHTSVAALALCRAD